MDYKNKYLKYKKKYLSLKSKVGGGSFEEDMAEAIRLSLEGESKAEGKSASGEAKESSASENDSFDNYPIILSRTEDGSFEAGSARGDGYCSIWSVIIGRSLISEQLFNPVLLEQYGKSHPENINQVVEILLDVSKSILSLMGEKYEFPLTDTMSIVKTELEDFISQLDLPFKYLNTITGVGQIKILSYLMNCNIIMKDITSNNIYSFNESGSTKIRISTNNSHYYTHNLNTTKEVVLVTDYWWNHMWTWMPYDPLKGKDSKMIPFIK